MMRPWSGATGSPRSSRRRTASTSFRFVRAPTPATAPASTGCTSATSRGPRPCCPPAASPANRSQVRWIGDPAGEVTSTIKLPATLEREFGIQRQDDKGFSPYPNAFRLIAAGQRARERTERRPGARHALPGADGIERRDREARRRRPLRLQGHQGPGLRHSSAMPGGSARRLTR